MEKKQAVGQAMGAAAGVTPFVVRKGEPTPDPSWAPAEGMPAYEEVIKPIEEHQTIADKLKYICAGLNARYEMGYNEQGERYTVLILPDKTRVGGAGANTAEAFNNLLARLQQFNMLEG